MKLFYDELAHTRWMCDKGATSLDGVCAREIDYKPYVSIKWQQGPYRGEVGEKNGACIEEVLIDAYVHLYEMDKKFPCHENQMAMQKIEEAVMWLDARTLERAERGVLGKEEE